MNIRTALLPRTTTKVAASLGLAVSLVAVGAAPSMASSEATLAARGNVYETYTTSGASGLCLAAGTKMSAKKRYEIFMPKCRVSLKNEQWTVVDQDRGSFLLVNGDTGAALDSNKVGEIYALPRNGGNYQKWWVRYEFEGNVRCFQNVESPVSLRGGWPGAWLAGLVPVTQRPVVTPESPDPLWGVMPGICPAGVGCRC